MNFEVDDIHYEFAATVSAALESAGSTAVARQLLEGADRSTAQPTLDRLANLGVMGLTVSEEYGGVGLSMTDSVLVLEELGCHLIPDDVALAIGTVAPIIGRHASAETAAAVLPALAEGRLCATVQDGWEGWAPWAGAADVVLVVTRDQVVIARSPARRELLDGSDPSRRIGRVAVGCGQRQEVLDSRAAQEGVFRAKVVTALTLLGVSRALIDQTVAYAKARKQFGRSIATFQAVKHQLADAFVDVEASRRAVWAAAIAIDSASPDVEVDVAMAKGLAAEAARKASYVALQVHGGIGYTWECDLHLWLKRAHALSAAWGGADEQWQRVNSIGQPT